MTLGFTHEPQIGGRTVEWYTPPSVFAALGVRFALDPCAPRGGLPWIPADEFYWLPEHDGLVLPWRGRVWMNPPYGPFTARWIGRFLDHGNGIALVFARTGTAWAQRALIEVDAVTFIAGRLKFVRDDGREVGTSGADSMLLACGPDNVAALRQSRLGTFFTQEPA